ncbi:MAG: hypothetical protein K2V38_17425, partial [Gemmataceae bacterium]|nr:hypothetical protein [Gemmataceae bacterium]
HASGPDGKPFIEIDDDAAGFGWFLDPTPRDDSEFAATEHPGEFVRAMFSPAAGRMDLLTVLSHELGHVLGRDDLHADEHAGDLMFESLPTGVRRVPVGRSSEATAPDLTPYCQVVDEVPFVAGEALRNPTSQVSAPSVPAAGAPAALTVPEGVEFIPFTPASSAAPTPAPVTAAAQKPTGWANTFAAGFLPPGAEDEPFLGVWVDGPKPGVRRAPAAPGAPR